MWVGLASLCDGYVEMSWEPAWAASPPPFPRFVGFVYTGMWSFACWCRMNPRQWQLYHVCGQDFKGRDKTCLHKGQVELGSSYLRRRPWLMWWRKRVREEASEGMGKTKIWAAFQYLWSPAAVGMNGKGSTVSEGGASVNRVDSECWNQASSICQEAKKRRHSQGGPRTLVYCHQVLSLKHQDRCIQVSLLQLLQAGLLEEACDWIPLVGKAKDASDLPQQSLPTAHRKCWPYSLNEEP